MTAEDVAYSLNRAADAASIVSFIYANVKSIDVTGDREVTVSFSKPDEMFNSEMTTIAGLIVEKEFTKTAGDDAGTPGRWPDVQRPIRAQVVDEWRQHRDDPQ